MRAAYAAQELATQRLLHERGIHGSFELFLRAFKEEQVLEVWGRERGTRQFMQLTVYPFCATSGTLGPKRKEGDLQIPEGVYHIQHFNPSSNFYLSLGINYPNLSDKKRGDALRPGSDIYLHGGCATIGCIPITDEKIKQLYLLAVEAREAGQLQIPVHIFPARLHEEKLQQLASAFPQHLSFWRNLQVVYADFEKTKTLRSVSINNTGDYYF